ncbi:NAD(P)-dependent oxidoreductase [Umezawaea endophytica]|uniref:NAD(P)H-binding protein n=1 Tax=Umezawaea endophytica TaxID=1654476 RepID=A0A9X2VL63_9PSEU|nr:NAD(P)H-binding protein [Umezawaea endophytica]MCS7478671.1 NAD(P)H-binding protein [Umezawaea endophytica]
MSKIVVFGAGGRGGRRSVEEALSRGHRVTAVVRDPAKYADLATSGAVMVAGDVTDADAVAVVAEGHDAAIVSVYRADVPADEFYGACAKAMLAGLGKAGVGRMVVLGIGTLLETAPGVRFMDQPGLPPPFRPFNLGRAVELEVLRTTESDVDWVVVAAPPTPLDDEAPRTGRYRTTGNELLPYDDGDGPTFDYPYDDRGPRFTFSDLAVALVDEADNPAHHRELVGVTHPDARGKA